MDNYPYYKSLFLPTLLKNKFENKKSNVINYNGEKWGKVKGCSHSFISEKGIKLLGIKNYFKMKKNGPEGMEYLNSLIANFDGIKYECSIVDVGEKKGYVYFVITNHGTKIGLSVQPKQRIRDIASSIPFRKMKMIYYKVYNMDIAEHCLHKIFIDKNISGEWFDLTNKDIDDGKVYLIKKHSGLFSGYIDYSKNKIKLSAVL